MKRVYAGAAGRFDERRNTSRVFPVPPGSGAAVVAELRRSRATDWYRWAVAYAAGEHLHGSKRAKGEPACCPVPGCPL